MAILIGVQERRLQAIGEADGDQRHDD